MSEVEAILYELSQGNPGAISVLVQLLKHEDGLDAIHYFIGQGIRGSEIWIMYKDENGEDINSLINSCRMANLSAVWNTVVGENF